jgi:hypothetical protein
MLHSCKLLEAVPELFSLLAAYLYCRSSTCACHACCSKTHRSGTRSTVSCRTPCPCSCEANNAAAYYCVNFAASHSCSCCQELLVLLSYTYPSCVDSPFLASRSGIQKPPSMDDMHAGSSQQQQSGSRSTSSSRPPSPPSQQQQQGGPHTPGPAGGTPGVPPLPPSGGSDGGSSGFWRRTRRVSSSIHIGMAAA